MLFFAFWKAQSPCKAERGKKRRRSETRPRRSGKGLREGKKEEREKRKKVVSIEFENVSKNVKH